MALWPGYALGQCGTGDENLGSEIHDDTLGHRPVPKLVLLGKAPTK